jgi:hypothetical protein
MLRVIVLILLAIGVGYGIAKSELSRSTAGLKHIYGSVEDIDAAIKNSKVPEGKQAAKVEVVGGAELNFGTMKQGTRRSHKFVFQNTGGASVDVWFKNSSCKCTVGKFERATLAPNETTEVELEWIVQGIGDFAQSATIGSNAPGQEEIRLSIRGKVGQPVMFSPSAVELGDFMSSEEAEISGHLFSFEELPLNITSTYISDTALAKKISCVFQSPRKPEPGEFPDFAEAKEVIDFKVKVSRGIPSGNISTNLNFNRMITDGSEEAFPLKISGRCVNPIRVIASNDYDEERDLLRMGIGSTKEGLKKSIVLSVKTTEFPDANITLRKVVPSSLEGKVKVTIDQPRVTKTQKMFPVTIEIPKGVEPIEMNGSFGKDFAKLIFDTNMQNSPEESIFLQFKLTE